MKTDKNNNTITEKNKFLSLIVRKKNKRKTSVLITILPLLSMLVAICPGVLHNAEGADIAKIGIISLVLTGTITFYIRLSADIIRKQKGSNIIIFIGYLVSITLLFLVPSPEIYSLWMIGGLVSSMLIDSKLGLLCNFNLTFILGFHLNLNPELVIQILIICVLISVLSGAIKNKTTVVYAVIIILSINTTIAFVINNFSFNKINNFDYVHSLFSILTVIIVSYTIAFLYQRFAKNSLVEELPHSPSSDSLEIYHKGLLTEPTIALQEYAFTKDLMSMELMMDVAKEDVTVISKGQPDKCSDNNENSYEALCDVENDLLRKLQGVSEELYLHAILIGELSARAARLIGANEAVAKAGGLYHEIGKLNGKNYIEEGLLIAEQHSFPNELKAIIREHNIKYDIPTSVEAAIVMLSDNVISTIDYIEKTDDRRYTTQKIIDNIFQMRFDKGTFDTSGLSLKDFKKLKEFYQEEFKNQ